MYKIYLVMSNLSGKGTKGYATKELAKKNKKLLEHIREVIVEEESDHN